MPREEIPVTPSVITWARKRAGFSIEEATEKFGKIAAWESEEERAFPTYPQLERLADTFKVPIAVFFFPEPPDLPPRAYPSHSGIVKASRLHPRETAHTLRARAFLPSYGGRRDSPGPRGISLYHRSANRSEPFQQQNSQKSLGAFNFF